MKDEELRELEVRYLQDAAFHARVELVDRQLRKHSSGGDAFDAAGILKLTADLEVAFLGTLQQVGWLGADGILWDVRSHESDQAVYLVK